jgi:cytidylate kinase
MASESGLPFKGEPAVLATRTEVPRHGFQGDRTAAKPATLPAGLTIALSREAGSRGASIARRVARKLGWQLYNQELLDTIAHEGEFSAGVTADLAPEAVTWVEENLQRLIDTNRIARQRHVIDLARVILAVAVQGEAVLIGRGAGYILPRATTLHVRVLAPLPDRVAYMSQWLRLTMDEAAEQVRLLDTRRAEFMQAHFHHQPGDIYQYDLLLNSSLLGEELSVALIAQAAHNKPAAHGSAATVDVTEPAG